MNVMLVRLSGPNLKMLMVFFCGELEGATTHFVPPLRLHWGSGKVHDLTPTHFSVVQNIHLSQARCAISRVCNNLCCFVFLWV